MAAEEKQDKGEFKGSCNRSACQQPGALWYNFGTQRYYCEACARLINEANRADSIRLFGHAFCLPRPKHERFEFEELQKHPGMKYRGCATLVLDEQANTMSSYDTTPEAGNKFVKKFGAYSEDMRDAFPRKCRSALELYIVLYFETLMPNSPMCFLGYVDERFEHLEDE